MRGISLDRNSWLQTTKAETVGDEEARIGCRSSGGECCTVLQRSVALVAAFTDYGGYAEQKYVLCPCISPSSSDGSDQVPSSQIPPRYVTVDPGSWNRS